MTPIGGDSLLVSVPGSQIAGLALPGSVFGCGSGARKIISS
jgi:hypothetical protein